MRRLVLVLVAAALVGLAAYRRCSLERFEQELAIGRHAPPADRRSLTTAARPRGGAATP